MWDKTGLNNSTKWIFLPGLLKLIYDHYNLLGCEAKEMLHLRISISINPVVLGVHMKGKVHIRERDKSWTGGSIKQETGKWYNAI